MKWTGKIVGLIIGMIFGNPLVILLGVVVGHLYDIGFLKRFFSQGISSKPGSTQQIFFDSIFTVMGFLAKLDGRVTVEEIHAVEGVMQKMSLSAELRKEAIRLFRIGKEPNFDLLATLQRLKQACGRHPELLYFFLETQIQIAQVEGPLHGSKWTAINTICAELGLQGVWPEQEEQVYQPFNYAKPLLSQSYRLLGIEPHASNTEIKKAYRRLLSKHHPDKLMAQGLPAEMIKMANEKTQKIHHAYETIKKNRQF